ncbi:hypothetical protein LY76DRAFT_639037 [Colletotrichum caudatum]|nr:hypothetical protein LY76DRAFT_639037 [Colletotrichum caudatum]
MASQESITATCLNFFSELLTKGVRYVYRYAVNPLVSNTGTSVRGTYGQDVTDEDTDEMARIKVEDEALDAIVTGSSGTKTAASISVTHVVPAIRIHDPTGAAVFFGNVTSAWGRSRHHGATRPPFRGDDGSYHHPPRRPTATARRSTWKTWTCWSVTRVSNVCTNAISSVTRLADARVQTLDSSVHGPGLIDPGTVRAQTCDARLTHSLSSASRRSN